MHNLNVVPMIDVVDRSAHFSSDKGVTTRLEMFKQELHNELTHLFEASNYTNLKNNLLHAAELDDSELFIEVFMPSHHEAWRNMLTVIIENRLTEQRFVCTPLPLKAMDYEQADLDCDEKWHVSWYEYTPDDDEVSGFKSKFVESAHTDVVWWHPCPIVVAAAIFANIQSCIWHTQSVKTTFPHYYNSVAGDGRVNVQKFIELHNSYHNSMDEKRFAAQTLLNAGFAEHKIHELLK